MEDKKRDRRFIEDGEGIHSEGEDLPPEVVEERMRIIREVPGDEEPKKGEQNDE